jgi:hypothetical protein
MANEREEVDLGGGQRAWIEPGMIEFRYSGTVDAESARRAAAVVFRTASDGAGGTAAVYVIDISTLDGFTPEARKVYATMPMPAGPQVGKIDLHLFIVGATLKSKAVFALVLAAAGLLGTVKFHSKHIAALDDARAQARALRDELAAAGALIK